MANRRPRVTAHHHREALTLDKLCGIGETTPSVDLVVEFDLHDHTGALIALEAAVADVRAQIEETRERPTSSGGFIDGSPVTVAVRPAGHDAQSHPLFSINGGEPERIYSVDDLRKLSDRDLADMLRAHATPTEETRDR
ncbi:hypothetical protein [Phycicoccus avicenniae]|uniref:hypothetical protein n=1 Tax=Phycicoccus avicenniae TaxID=2828860 RepID=UPI003D277678